MPDQLQFCVCLARLALALCAVDSATLPWPCRASAETSNAYFWLMDNANSDNPAPMPEGVEELLDGPLGYTPPGGTRCATAAVHLC